jgi:hypothetical protein
MSLRELLRKFKEWLPVFLFIGLLSVYTALYLQSFPRYIPIFSISFLFLAALAIVLGFPQKRRERFRKLIEEFQGRWLERGGWFYRYRRKAFFLLLLTIIVTPILAYLKLVPTKYFSFIAIAAFFVILASGAVLVIGFLKSTGKWGLLFVLILTLFAVLRIWTWWLL